MQKRAGIWEGLVRRYQEDRFAAVESANEASSSAVLPDAITSEQRMAADISATQKKTAQHLQLPLKRERVVMGKVKVFFVILLFLLAGFLFFVGGFLTCYTMFPPRAQVGSMALRMDEALSSSQAAKNLMIPPVMSDAPQTYADRQALLRGVNPADKLLERAQADAQYQSAQQAIYAAKNTISSFTSNIRNALGRYVGGAVAPVTQNLGQATVDLVLPNPGRPAQTTTPSSPSQGTAPASQNRDASKQAAQVPASPTGSQGQGSQAAPPSPSSQARFTVQVQSFNTSDEAFNLASALRERGFGAYVAREQTATSVRFGVRVGQFATYQEAQEGVRLLNHETQLVARVMMLEGTNDSQ